MRMRNILAEIIAKKREIVEEAKKAQPLYEVRKKAKAGCFAMSQKFRAEKWSLIAECKLQSPAKGRLCKKYTVEELAHIYMANGASMLSVHTDPHFLGSNADFIKIRSLVDLPLLRKDFIIDTYQIYESRMLGADAILLIARILTIEELKKFIYLAWKLGMDCLVEVHDREDLEKALATPAEFIGINNRNLKTFETSIENTLDLLPYMDKERTLISESGIFAVEDAMHLQKAGCDGILVGEGLVKAEDIARMTRMLKNPSGEITQIA